MAFDPTKPADHAEIIAAELRGQFTALAALLTAQDARLAALEAALGGTAKNPNLGTLSLSLDDPPNRPQVQAILDQLNTLLNQITRV